MLLPLALFLCVFAVWSAYWVVARGIAADRLDHELAQARMNGTVLDCSGQSLGGYPFRFEWRCVAPRLERVTAGGPVILTANHVTAVALAYNPRHVIVEVDGPMQVMGEAPVPYTLELDWARLVSSLRISNDGISRLDLSIEHPAGWLTPEGGRTRASASADTLELHLKRSDDETLPQAWDVAVRTFAAILLQPGREVTVPADAGVIGTISHAGLLDPDAMQASLAAWRDAGGLMSVNQIALRQGEIAVELTGELGLDSLGRPEGQFVALAAGVDPSAPIGEGITALAAAGLGALGTPAELDGRPATEVDVVLSDGVVRIGLLPVSGLPSLTD
ncbi:MAG: DUF2125 domain-containing protein [Pseudomonadota bacterium]